MKFPATLFQRFLAYFIDGILLSPLTVLHLYNFLSWKSPGLFLFINLLSMLYKPLMEGWKGYTLGKNVMKIRVCREDGQTLGFGQSFLRNIFQLSFEITSLIITFYLFRSTVQDSDAGIFDVYVKLQKNPVLHWLGLINLGLWIIEACFILFTKQNQSLHDLLAKTLVTEE